MVFLETMASFLPTHDLVISRGRSNVTSRQSVNHIAYYKYKAECGWLKTWICLSIHWKNDSSSKGSYIYCNGKKKNTFE